MKQFGKRGAVSLPASTPSIGGKRNHILILCALAVIPLMLVLQLPTDRAHPVVNPGMADVIQTPPHPETTSDNPVIEVRQSRPLADHRTYCKARHPLDYDRRSTCENIQQEARHKASTFRIDLDVGILCTERYPDDWSMFVTCASSQMNAKLPAASKPERPDFNIGKKCSVEWPHDYNMENYCLERQRDAKARAGNWIDRRIGIHCTGEYPSDWTMFMYCVDQQTKARTRLR